MRRVASLLFPLVAFGVALACSSASTTPSPKPATTVDCHAVPPSSGSQLKCEGVCIAHDFCSDAGEACPAGLTPEGYGTCPNQALCCRFQDGGVADAETDASADAATGD